MHALSLNSKFLIERNIFPAFLTTQIDQSSPADSILHRPWKAPKEGFKTSRLFISQILFVQSEINTWWVIDKWINFIVNLKHKYIYNILYFNLKSINFLPWKKQISFIWIRTSSPFFPCKFLCRMKRYSCYWYLSQWQAKLFITFVIARVPSSLVLV